MSPADFWLPRARARGSRLPKAPPQNEPGSLGAGPAALGSGAEISWLSRALARALAARARARGPEPGGARKFWPRSQRLRFRKISPARPQGLFSGAKSERA